MIIDDLNGKDFTEALKQHKGDNGDSDSTSSSSADPIDGSRREQ